MAALSKKELKCAFSTDFGLQTSEYEHMSMLLYNRATKREKTLYKF